MLTHRLPLTNILFKIARILHSQFKCNYLKKQKTLSEVFVPFMESTSNFKHFEKKGWLSLLWYFRNYRLWKSCLDHSLKSTISEHALTVNMSKRPKYLRNLHESAFVKILTICDSQFKCNYLENEKLCLHFLFNFWNLNQILNVLKKRIIVIANVFPILQTAKNLLRTVSKEGRFRPGFDSQHVKASQILAKSP